MSQLPEYLTELCSFGNVLIVDVFDIFTGALLRKFLQIFLPRAKPEQLLLANYQIFALTLSRFSIRVIKRMEHPPLKMVYCFNKDTSGGVFCRVKFKSHFYDGN